MGVCRSPLNREPWEKERELVLESRDLSSSPDSASESFSDLSHFLSPGFYPNL